MTPDESTPVVHPDWMFAQPMARFDQALRGVRYDFFYDHAKLIGSQLDGVAVRQAWRLCCRYAAIGPALFYARSNGPWINYDPRARDENFNCPVAERSPPWNFGDRLWEVWSLPNDEVMTVDRAIDDVLSLFVWPERSIQQAARWVQRFSARTSQGKAVDLL